MTTVRLLAGRDGSTVRVQVADTAWTRMVGLLGRRSLPADEGLLLAPAWSIHTWAMRFAIDLVFLDRDGMVLRVVEALPPWRLVSVRGAAAVVELAAHRARTLGVTEHAPLSWKQGAPGVRSQADPNPAE